MSRASAVSVGRTLEFALAAGPAVAPAQQLLTAGAELVGLPISHWLAFLLAVPVGVVLAATYDGSSATVFGAAILAVVLYIILQWVVGLRQVNVISPQLLVADAFVYLAAASSALVIVSGSHGDTNSPPRNGKTDSRADEHSSHACGSANADSTAGE
ncbi:hypothetical protein [Natronorubrum sulfidifaciens]|uniref:Uncharacterized protein n=1 Tax=Natronorubrum sulfidifaciens JCM 14089 TaxID=1230460 RepID=L9WG14_9EURY|nr:hypothetical protein [Natronorubrum sulfidifaciens]ELY48292.1 hypothetical protein C495_02420 [Natronorubrum sulfidifaciens JCM 14089]